MPMKITGQTSSQYTNASNDIKRQPHGDKAQQSVTAAKNHSETNSINLSDQASMLSSLAQLIETLPIIDETRVKEIKVKIDNGKYIPDYLQVAEKLISSEQAIH